MVIKEGEQLEVMNGGDVTLTCKVIAYPEPNIVWEDALGNIIPNTSVSIDYNFCCIKNK